MIRLTDSQFDCTGRSCGCSANCQFASHASDARRRTLTVCAALARLLTILLCCLCPATAQAAEPISLAGEWRFTLDRADAGIEERWFDRDFADRILLPGALQAQGYGDPVTIATPWILSLYDRFWYLREEYKDYIEPGRVKVPFLSQPPRHYLGPAWYQREIEIPAGWQSKRVILTLERPHWETIVWVDGQRIGSNRSLVAPHVYDLGALAPGRHRLSIRINNRLLMPYRPDAHSVSDSLGGSWNGIAGKIEIAPRSLVWIDDAQVYPDVARRSARVKVRIGNLSGRAGAGAISTGTMSLPVRWQAQGGAVEFEVSLGEDAGLWDEFNPNLHRLRLRLTGDEADDRREIIFGLREFRAVKRQFVINGRPTYLRGTHHGGDFPLTGYPPTDVEYWRRLIRICQSWGLNHLRFHSYCPPEAAFVAADELGFYLQPEAGMWNEISPGTEMERMMYEETDRMIKAYGNHPSFVLLSPSNEPKGRWKESLPRWVEHYRKLDPRRLYTTGTGWSLIDVPGKVEGADFLAVHRIGPLMLRGASGWFGRDYSKSLEGVDVPVATHELGQWAAYPDFDIIRKFTGYLRPGNYEIFRDSMMAKGLIDRNREFAWASGRYQLACYKEEIEANLRTPGLGGFQLLDLHDYLGQGTALVGLLDAFWESKGYATPEEFRRFCNTTVPLARFSKRVFTTDERLDVEVEVAHYGAAAIEKAEGVWKIVNSQGRVVEEGEWPAQTISRGGNAALGRVRFDLGKLGAPAEYRLVVGIKGTEFENDWNFWLYPARIVQPEPRDVLVTRSWDEAEARLEAGGKVLYIPRDADLDWWSPPLDELPIFWNRQMGPAWSRMLGILADKEHRALAGFPTAEHFDWQWRELVRHTRAINLDRLPANLQPIVQAIDDWNRNYKLGLIFECQVGTGRLMVSAIDLESGLAERVVAQQLRSSILSYMAGPVFRPLRRVSAREIRGLLFDTQIMRRLGAVARAPGQVDERAPNSPAKAIDGDPNTYWFTGPARQGGRHPHTLTISFPAAVAMSGVVIMPRQNHREHEGDIREYSIQVSDDEREWREVKYGALKSTFAPQEVRFGRVINARHLKIVAASGFGEDGTAAIAELAVIYEGPKLADTLAGRIDYQPVGTATVEIDDGRGLPGGGPALRFDFGPGRAAPGYRQVLPTTIYSSETGYGFEPGALSAQIVGIERDALDPVRGDLVTSDRPFYFSVALSEGNYHVRITLGDLAEASSTTVKAELRRLMLERVETAPGQLVTRTVTVNVRRPQIAGGGEVRLKERERTVEAWAWDEKLTLEFNGARPAIAAIEISPANVPTIFLLGDSTVCDQPREPYGSWGQMLTRFFQPTVAIANHAESGESLRSSFAARRVDKVLSLLRRGDYLFIQYGHNDQKEVGPGIGPYTSYRLDLHRLVLEAQRRGAIPVLVTSMHRRSFDEHGRVRNTLGDYPDAMRMVARQMRVPLVNLHAASALLYEALGVEGSAVLFRSGDLTHHSNYGSYQLAKCVVEGVKANRLALVGHLVPELRPYDPRHPDPVEEFRVPASPQAGEMRPLGN